MKETSVSTNSDAVSQNQRKQIIRSSYGSEKIVAQFDGGINHWYVEKVIRAFLFPHLKQLQSKNPASTSPVMVADIGCATGRDLEFLLKSFPMIHAVGIDITPAMIETAEKNLSSFIQQGRAELITGDIESLLNSQQRRFDIIMMNYVLSSLDEPLPMLEKLKTLLTPTGKIMIIEGVSPEGDSRLMKYLKSMWAHIVFSTTKAGVNVFTVLREMAKYIPLAMKTREIPEWRTLENNIHDEHTFTLAKWKLQLRDSGYTIQPIGDMYAVLGYNLFTEQGQ
jgi:ubiquinone/menaquinone biosynthesis C-methylase UbiE